MYKAVAFDIDDTIYHHPTKRLVPSTIEAIKKLKAKGYIIIIATGRDMREGVNREILEIIQPDAVISLNGQLVQIADKVIYEFKFSPKLKTKIFDYAIENNISLGAMMENTHYINWYSDYAKRYIRELEKAFNYTIINKPLLEAINNDIASISYYDDSKAILPLLEANPEIKTIHYDGYGGNIMAKDISKASGIEKIFSYFNFSFNELIFFGDGDNDLEILEQAGMGCAVGKSSINAQKVANVVTDLIENDGIYKTLIEYKIID